MTAATEDSPSEGIKHDHEKPRLDLIPPELLIELGYVMAAGAEKYDERNWEKGMAWGRPYAACLRHLLAWHMGEDDDQETGLPHLAHAAANVAFLIAFTQRGTGRDDRPDCTTAEERGS
jgi:hypothetical protein